MTVSDRTQCSSGRTAYARGSVMVILAVRYHTHAGLEPHDRGCSRPSSRTPRCLLPADSRSAGVPLAILLTLNDPDADAARVRRERCLAVCANNDPIFSMAEEVDESLAD